MNRAVHVLVVEDSEEDTLLLTRELRRGGFDPTLERVETPETMRNALAARPWDLVIADYTMPHFSGTEALELLRKSGVEAPFIFLSGTLGEETAVAAMKVGAHDYIMKGNLKRLVPAIERELREADVRKQRKRAEKQVQRQQEQMRILHEINLAITSTLNLKSILELLLEKIDLVLPFATATTIRLLSKETGRLDPVACRNLDETEWKGDPWSAARGVSQLVFDSMGPMLIHDIQTNPRIENKEFYRKQDLVSYLGVPLVAKGHSLGVIGFYTKEKHEFTVDEIDFLSALARQAAIAIQNAQLYEQIKKQAVDLERANRVKSEFLSVVSHELRTPLSAIMGYAGMVLEKVLGEISPGQSSAVRKIVRYSNDLLAMINSILEVTRMEVEEVNAEILEVDLHAFLDDLKSIYAFPVEKEIVLIWDVSTDLPAMRTDVAKLKHILENLINNAIKFTNRGSITISVRCFPITQTVEFKVADTGIGIPQESLERIFDMFHQVNSSDARTYGGVGLGLYIVKKFTALLGGTIRVASKEGEGSTFAVTLPLSLSNPLSV